VQALHLLQKKRHSYIIAVLIFALKWSIFIGYTREKKNHMIVLER
jgi:hypothetical protein